MLALDLTLAVFWNIPRTCCSEVRPLVSINYTRCMSDKTTDNFMYEKIHHENDTGVKSEQLVCDH